MLELLFLLLPIAAAYGWYMGRRSMRVNQQRSQQNLSRNYVEGLNFLLSDQPDKAVDRFIELLQVDSDTFDTHLSLGNLFRKRGEVDRSIRLHQNLIARPYLEPEQKDLAMMELAKDFLAAGLYDRAEEILLQLVKEPDHSQESEQLLLSIYQANREWWKAIRLVKKFRRADRQSMMPQVAHFYCQLAEQEADPQQQRKLWFKALKVDSGCGRANIALFRQSLDQGEDSEGMAAVERLVKHSPEWLCETLPDALIPFERQQRLEQYEQLLEQVMNRLPATSAVLALAELVVQKQGREAAQQLILSQLKRHPTLRGFHRLMGLHTDALGAEPARDSLMLLSDLVEKQIRLRPKYRCLQCGFPGHSLHWQCPSCKSWGQIQRIRGLDGE
ncbi:lipopolysaccharide assembly protein LapB [Ferrimonas marina]|uniref:Lipopolysaccharide assembly protein B n=1 Tax=Ferrimonas marina TaxID=299255 RepID=A0A1M5NAS7_9GAMM|nr:lipopolysaccharide assembly protein LapB [Ferrimonas marina]SHG86598.1 Lipopolysaccharide biosynthesis regulator YciM, contains six TPR domains and a predicted metal-binding C-terminal domain [Ferrimonas marina]